MTKEHRRSRRLGWLAASAGLGLACLIAAPFRGQGQTKMPPPPTPEQAAFFESKIRPLLLDNCTACHNKDLAQGGLRLDTREGLIKGGDSGTAILSGAGAKNSLLLTVVHQTGAIKMPKGGDKLKPTEIADLEAWVALGAPWPQAKGEAAPSNTAPNGEYQLTPAQKAFWSLQPVKTPALPVVKNKAWAAQNPIDAFVLAGLERAKLAPAAPADKRTLLRRVSYDLIGLPPTPEETAAFLADKSPNAYAKVVDRLLASPRYGERQARLWMDVARYADTKGYVFVDDRNYPNAYTYRNWIIDAFNADLGYDKFITYQLAADLMPEVQSGPDKKPLAAMGFLNVGRRFLNSVPDITDDRIDVTMRGFQGFTVACARCHDHKFDPIPTKDYYSLYGVFASSKEAELPISPAAISDPYMAHQKAANDKQNAARELVKSEVKRMRELIKTPPAGSAPLPDEVTKTLQGFREDGYPSDEQIAKILPGFTPEARQKASDLKTEITALGKSVPPKPEMAMATVENDPNYKARIFKRGNQGNQGDEAPRRFLLALSPANAPRPEWTGSGRLDLARAIASPTNPLTARVWVNRLWQGHFGNGIVRTPSDFGKQGQKPTNPALLDYLAAQLVKNNWSTKKMHRLIVLSQTYQMASDASPKAAQDDPENRLLSYQNRRRLDMEQLRDSLFWASGKLDTKKVGGKSEDLWSAPFSPRRAVYGFVERQNLPGTFRTFDFASPDATMGQRFRTTVPQQALFVMNSPLVVEQARSLAALDTLAKSQDDAQKIRKLYLRLFDRLPDADEAKLGLAYLKDPAPTKTGGAAAQTAPEWEFGWGGWDAQTKQMAFTPLAHFVNNIYQAGEKIPDEKLGYVSVGQYGGHPGRDAAHAVVRKWVSPLTGTVKMAGLLKHPDAQGDGVRAWIISSRAGVLSEWMARNSETHTDLPAITVQKGDVLYFAVDCVGSDAFDGFIWSPVLTHSVPKNSDIFTTVWDSGLSFRGPQAPLPPPLTRWERYAQALLMTDEFTFVD